MTKEITKAFILQEMQDKLKLRELIPEKFSFSEMVVPAYNIEQHLQHWKIVALTQSVTGTGNLLFMTVPMDRRLTLHRYDVVFMTGAYTAAGVNIVRTDGTPNSAYLDLAAAQSVSYHVDLPTPVILNPGDIIYVNIDGYTSTGNLRLYLDYMTEEIR